MRPSPPTVTDRATKRHLELVCAIDHLTHWVMIDDYDHALAGPKHATAACGRSVHFGPLGARGHPCPRCTATLTNHATRRVGWLTRIRSRLASPIT